MLLSTAIPTVIAATVIVIISNGSFSMPIIPSTNSAEIKLGMMPINIKEKDLNNIKNINAITNITKPSDFI